MNHSFGYPVFMLDIEDIKPNQIIFRHQIAYWREMIDVTL
jgi:hypothetical protein